MISQTELQQILKGDEEPTKGERIAEKGKYAKNVLNSPLDPRTHTIENERQHKN